MYSKIELLRDLQILNEKPKNAPVRKQAYERLYDYLSKQKQVAALLLPKKGD